MDMVLYALLKKQIGAGGISDDKIKQVLTQFLLEHPEYIGATEEQVEQIAANTAASDLLYKTLYGVKKGTDAYPSSTIYQKDTEYTIPKGQTIFFRTIPTKITINGTEKTIDEREYTFEETGKFTTDNTGYLFKGIAYDILDGIKNISISKKDGNLISMEDDGLYANVDDITDIDINNLF